MRTVAGIDFSIRCPAMCIHVGDSWSPANCHFFYLYGVKKWIRNDRQISSELHQEFANNIERLDWITSWFVDRLHGFKLPEVFIEEYSFSRESSSTHILAEGCGVLKNKIHHSDLKIETLPVKTIKKVASGNGNATKEVMCSAFLGERSWLNDVLPCPLGKPPLADLVDAYFVAKMGFHKTS